MDRAINFVKTIKVRIFGERPYRLSDGLGLSDHSLRNRNSNKPVRRSFLGWNWGRNRNQNAEGEEEEGEEVEEEEEEYKGGVNMTILVTSVFIVTALFTGFAVYMMMQVDEKAARVEQKAGMQGIDKTTEKVSKPTSATTTGPLAPTMAGRGNETFTQSSAASGGGGSAPASASKASKSSKSSRQHDIADEALLNKLNERNRYSLLNVASIVKKMTRAKEALKALGEATFDRGQAKGAKEAFEHHGFRVVDD